jgi:DNA-binding transcriptional ArsR family regulator
MPSSEPSDHETFELLGHEMRLAIIERLAEERRTNWRPSGLEFAQLRKAVGVRDAGQFNYHLDKLLDTFVEKRDGEYVLTTAGMEVAGTVKAGTYGAADVSFDATIDATCNECDAGLEATYDRGTLTVRCPDHGLLHGNAIPPAAVRDRAPEAVVALAELNARNELDRALSGACVHCWGSVDVQTPVELPQSVLDHQNTSAEALEQVIVEFACSDCGMTFWTPASATIVDHPAVVSFYHDHGVNVRDRGILDLPFVDGTNGTVESADPIRVRVDVTHGDDELHVWLDDTATVVDHDTT